MNVTAGARPAAGQATASKPAQACAANASFRARQEATKQPPSLCRKLSNSQRQRRTYWWPAPRALTTRAWLPRLRRRHSRLLQAESTETPARRSRAAADPERKAKSRQPSWQGQARRMRRAARRMARNATRADCQQGQESRARQAMRQNPATAVRYQKKLARANRRVSKSVQATARNNARVAFVVMADGSIGDLQLAESSGSAELDQFALALVRQAGTVPAHSTRDRQIKLGIQSAQSVRFESLASSSQPIHQSSQSQSRKDSQCTSP